jgi:hypothetical protein
MVRRFIPQLFKIPRLFGGGDHWPLSKDESDILTDAIDDYVKSLKGKKSKLVKVMTDYSPVLMFAFAVFLVMLPRLAITFRWVNNEIIPQPTDEPYRPVSSEAGSGATAYENAPSNVADIGGDIPQEQGTPRVREDIASVFRRHTE